MTLLYSLKRFKIRKKKELVENITQYLEPGEVVEHYAIGKSSMGQMSPRCLLVLTNKKLIRYSRFLWNVGVVYIPIESITLLDEVKTLARQEYVVYFMNGFVRIYPSYETEEASLKNFMAALKKRVEEAGSAPKQAGGADIPDQIRKLAKLAEDGILTGAEFEAKKQELLKRM